MSTRRAVLFRAGLVLLGCLFGLLLAELSLRAMGYRLDTSAAYQPDPFCGARLTPGFLGWHTTEGRTLIKINEHGFRDQPRSVNKRPGVFRIAVLGDSYSEALQVELKETFWSVLEAELREKLPPNGIEIEVLNFGVSGYSTAQELQMLRHYVWPYEPDLILLQFFAANDVVNNSKKLADDLGRPFFSIINGELVLDDSFLNDPTRIRFETSRWIRFKDYLVHHSRLAALVYQLRHRQDTSNDDNYLEAGLDLRAFQEPQDTDWEKAWELTDRLIENIAREAKLHGIPLIVLMANCGVEIDFDSQASDLVAAELGITDFEYPARRLRSLGDKHGFLVVTPADKMREYAMQHQRYLHGFSNTRPGKGHWNMDGHRLAGQVAAEKIMEAGLPPGEVNPDSGE